MRWSTSATADPPRPPLPTHPSARPLWRRWMLAATLALSAGHTAAPLPADEAIPVPPSLHAEGIPPIPTALQLTLQRYLKLGGAGFRGWHSRERQIVVTSRNGDAVQLHTMSAPGGKRTPLTKGAEPVTEGWYQPGEGRWFVFPCDHAGNEAYQLYALDPATGKTVLLTDGQSRNTGAKWSHDGRWLAYTSTRRNGRDNDVYVVDPADPATTRCLMKNAAASWSVADWSRDDARIFVRHTISDDLAELREVDRRTGASRLLVGKEAKASFRHPRFAENDSAIYALDDAEGDFMALKRYDLASHRRSALTGHLAWDLETFELSPDGRTVAFVTNEDGFSRLHLLDVATRRELPVPNIPGSLISDLAWHPQLRELGFTLSGAQSPNDAYSLDVDTGRLTRWTDRISKATDAPAFVEPELVRAASFDGLPISSLVYRPDAKRFPGKRPVILMIHGGPASQARPGFRGQNNYYLDALGIALVYPNVRGSTGYGHKFTTLDNGLHRADAVEDIGAVLAWIRRDAQFDERRLAVVGGSYGGFMTLACLVRYYDVFRCGVDSAGIANFVTFLQDTSDWRRADRRAEYGDERKNDIRAFLGRISPLNHADRIKAPLFIIQGQNDPRVSVTEAERMRNAIRAHGGEVWYLLASDEGHGYHRKTNIDFGFYATVTFLQKYLLE